MEIYNYEIVRGDTSFFEVSFDNLEGTIDEMYFSCKKDINDNTYVFQKSLTDGITSNNGVYTIRIAPEDTDNEDLGTYYYDIEITSGQDIYTIVKGNLILGYEVTQ